MEIIYYVAASLDGYIATPKGAIDWLSPYEGTGEYYGYGEFYASVEALLIGRATYEKSLEFPEWPYAGKPYWVFSRADGNDPVTVMAEMKRRGLRRAWLVGGGKLASGIPLFDGPGARESLRLISSRAYPNGVVQLRYARAL